MKTPSPGSAFSDDFLSNNRRICFNNMNCCFDASAVTLSLVVAVVTVMIEALAAAAAAALVL